MSKNKAIILLSGGLDSAVSLASEKENIGLALFFNYGQKSFEQEKIAVENLSEYYNIKYEIIDLPWLKNITQTSLVNQNNDIPIINEENLDNKNVALQTMKQVWVPNRNALFLNIAACYADSFGYKKIIIGANKEEARTFSDNSRDFIDTINQCLKFSTQVHPEIVAPLINFDKKSIIEYAVKLNLPFEFIRSCYSDSKKHCGKCESCKRLKKGLESQGLFDIVNLLFSD